MARSILKDNTAPLPSTSRRVSFAPEVTLHQIEVRNPNKRRKTDGGASGYASFSSESDFEIVHYLSQQELMKEDEDEVNNNDHLMNLSPIGIRAKDIDDVEFEDSPDDGSKPLTDSSDEEIKEQKERPVLSFANKRAKVVRSLDDGNVGTEVSMELTGRGNGIAKVSDTGTPLVYASDEDADYSSNDEEEVPNSINTDDRNHQEEEEMQLTGRIEKVREERLVRSIDEPEDMQLTVPISTATSRRYQQPTPDSDDAYEGEDDTINLAASMLKVDALRSRNQAGKGAEDEQDDGHRLGTDRDEKVDNGVNDSSNMELTERISRVAVPQIPIVKPNLEALPDVDDDEDDEDEDRGVKDADNMKAPLSAMEKLGPIDMEITEPVSNETAHNKQSKQIGASSVFESQEMDLSEPINKLTIESLRGKNNEQALHLQDMELTQPVKSVVNKDQQASIEHGPEHGTNDNGSLPKLADFTEVITQGEHLVSMDLTQRQIMTNSQQTMELTQNKTVISRYDDGKLAKQAITSTDSKKSISNDAKNEKSETATPLATVSQNWPSQEINTHEKDPDPISNAPNEVIEDRFANYKPVSLSTFLQDIHMKFDTDIGTLAASLIGTDSNESTLHQQPSIYELILAIPFKEGNALNDFIVQELQNYIRDGEQLFQDFSKQIGDDNLAIMKEFYTTNDAKDREIMIICLNNVRYLSKLESRSTWFKWRSTLTQHVIDEMDNQIELLKQCQKDLEDYLQRLDEQWVKAGEYKSEVMNKLYRLRTAKKTMGNLSQEQVDDMRNAFNQLKSQLKDLAEKIDQARYKLAHLDQSLVELRNQKRDLLNQAKDIDFELEKRKSYTKNEKIEIKKRYDQLTSLTHLKYIRTEDVSSMVFLYYGMINVKFDFDKGTFEIGEIHSNEFKFKLLINYVYHFPVSVTNDGKGSTLYQWQRFKSYWAKLIQLDSIMDFIKFQWPIELIPNEETGGVIKFQFDYFDFDSRRRFIVDASLAVASLLHFESSIIFSIKPARNFILSEKEIKKTLTKLGKSIDLPKCGYNFISDA